MFLGIKGLNLVWIAIIFLHQYYFFLLHDGLEVLNSILFEYVGGSVLIESG